MYRVKSFKPDSHQIITQAAIVEKFRNNIWTIIDNWTLRLLAEKETHTWHNITKTQLIDNMPALLAGIVKTIEHPANLIDLEPGGLMYETAARFGANRRLINYEPSELLFEQEIIRNAIWSYCHKSLTGFDIFELEDRIGKSLDKVTFAIVGSYIKEYANELTYLARRDKVTGFLTHGSYREALNAEISRSKRYRRACSLILMEIDGFNLYREIHGNVAADNLTELVSKIITRLIRSVDIPARHGANSFAIILPEASTDQARKVAERIRRAIRQETRHEVRVRDTIKQPVTISAGISTYKKIFETADEFEDKAKKSLINAKKNGDMSI